MEPKTIYIMRHAEDDGFNDLTRKGFGQCDTVRPFLGDPAQIDGFIYSSGASRTLRTGEAILGTRLEEILMIVAPSTFEIMYFENGEEGAYGFPTAVQNMDESATRILVVEQRPHIERFAKTMIRGKNENSLLRVYLPPNHASVFAISYDGLWSNFGRKVSETIEPWPYKLEWAYDPRGSAPQYVNKSGAALREAVDLPPGGRRQAEPAPDRG